MTEVTTVRPAACEVAVLNSSAGYRLARIFAHDIVHVDASYHGFDMRHYKDIGVELPADGTCTLVYTADGDVPALMIAHGSCDEVAIVLKHAGYKVYRGEPSIEVLCDGCGTANDETDAYCRRCGGDL